MRPKAILKKIGSLYFAVALIVGLAVILTISTFLESHHGTPAAKSMVYDTLWFDLFLSLVWINIFCSTLTRWPFERRHLGFVITHIGILTLLLGTLISRLTGIEGQVTLFEGEMKDKMRLTGYELLLTDENNRTFETYLKPEFKIKGSKYTLPLNDSQLKVSITKTLENAVPALDVTEGAEEDPKNRAAFVTLKSNTLSLDESFWLVEHDPENPGSSAVSLGPAEFKLLTKPEEHPSSDPVLKIKRIVDQKTQTESIPLKKPIPSKIPVFSGEFSVSNLSYFSHAKIVNNKMVNSPEDFPENPAVEFQITDKTGQTETHAKFSFFPQFPSIRGGEPNNKFNLEIDLDAPHDASHVKTPGLTLTVDDNNAWLYSARSKQSEQINVPLVLNQKIQPGWMDMELTVQKTFTRAKLGRTWSKGKPGQGFEFAAELLFEDSHGKKERAWVYPDNPATFESGKRFITARIYPKMQALPFSLHLADFRKIDYPGTSKPSAFESDVILFDRPAGVTMEKKIYMNHPLDYKGFRIFQASYMIDPEVGEASVFSVAKNPGIWLIYPGGLTILAGVIILFYFTKHKK